MIIWRSFFTIFLNAVVVVGQPGSYSYYPGYDYSYSYNDGKPLNNTNPQLVDPPLPNFLMPGTPPPPVDDYYDYGDTPSLPNSTATDDNYDYYDYYDYGVEERVTKPLPPVGPRPTIPPDTYDYYDTGDTATTATTVGQPTTDYYDYYQSGTDAPAPATPPPPVRTTTDYYDYYEYPTDAPAPVTPPPPIRTTTDYYDYYEYPTDAPAPMTPPPPVRTTTDYYDYYEYPTDAPAPVTPPPPVRTTTDYYDYYDTDEPVFPTTQPTTIRPPIKPADCTAPSVGRRSEPSRYTEPGEALMIFTSLRFQCDGEIFQWEFVPTVSNISRLYLAVFRKNPLPNAREYILVGMNNPRFKEAVPNQWNTWQVPENSPSPRIQVKPGDVVGIFYTKWTNPNEPETFINTAVPDAEETRVLDTVETLVSPLLSLTEVVQKYNGFVDIGNQDLAFRSVTNKMPAIRALLSQPTSISTVSRMFILFFY